VILSACESGAAEIRIDEGVISLRRAFRIARAGTVLASNWHVSDKATDELMTTFMTRSRSGEQELPRGRRRNYTCCILKTFRIRIFGPLSRWPGNGTSVIPCPKWVAPEAGCDYGQATGLSIVAGAAIGSSLLPQKIPAYPRKNPDLMWHELCFNTSVTD